MERKFGFWLSIVNICEWGVDVVYWIDVDYDLIMKYFVV